MVNEAIIPLVSLMFSSAVAPFVSRFGEYVGFPKIRGVFTLSAFAITLNYVFNLLPSVPYSFRIEVFGGPYGVELYVSALSIYIAMVSLIIFTLVSLYSIKYMEADNGLDKYYTLLLTMATGIVGALFSGDFFTLYVFWELSCVSSYSLVSFRKYRWQAVEGGIKYLIMSTVGSLIALYGISLLYGVAGTLNFKELAQIISQANITAYPPSVFYMIIFTIIVGFGVSSAIVPFHSWVPDAYVGAPNCVVALSSVAIKIAAFSIMRVLFTVFDPLNFDYGILLIFFGLLSLTFGNIMALMQNDIRRLLAFSSISNMGYIFTGIGIGSYLIYQYGMQAITIFEIVMVGVFLQILTHVFGKSLLFLAIGNFSQSTKSYSLEVMEGIGRKMPITGFSAVVGLLGLAGIPPLSGFWSKLFIISASGSSFSNPIIFVTLGFIVFNSILDAAYYIWVVQRIFFKPLSEKGKSATEVSILMWLPVVILAVLLIIVTLQLDFFVSFARTALRSFIGGG